MATRCQTCLSKHLTEISDLLDSNTLTLKEIAAQFHVSYPSLVRHCSRHRNSATPTVGSAGADLKSKSDLLWSRADEIWARAAADDDLRSAIQSVQTGLRSLELQAKQREREQEQETASLSDDGKIPIQWFDAIHERWDQWQAQLGQQKAEEALEYAHRMDPPNMMGVYYACCTDPVLRELVQTTCRDYQNAKDGWKENSDESVQTKTAPPTESALETGCQRPRLQHS